MIETGFVEVAGTRVRVARRGGRGVPLLLCNGIGANVELLFPLVEALAGVPVIAFDVPGTGESPAAAFWPTPATYVRCALGVLDALAQRGPFAVGGISWGGALAQLLARRAAERVRGLVLIATGPGVLMIPGKLSALLPMATPLRYFSRRHLLRHAPSIYGGEVARDPSLALAFAQASKPPSLVGYLQQLLAMSHFSSLPWLGRIRCPALVVAGGEDPLVRPINARLLAALLPNAQLHVIPGAGHLFPMLQPERTAKVLLPFLAELHKRT